jgi:acyl-CoA synthetase (AMP-forming)/AMP-acid ligase II
MRWHDLDVPTVTLIRERRARTPDAVALIVLANGERETERVTFAEIDAAARRWATHLRRCGLVGKPVLLPAQSERRFVEALCGCLYAGTIAVPVPPVLRGQRAQRTAAIADHAGAAGAIDVREPPASAGLLAHVPWIRVPNTEASDAGADSHHQARRGDPALLQYTSGSTGHPRGVVITHGNLASNLGMLRASFDVHAHSSMLIWLPLYHDMGLIMLLLSMVCGMPCILMPPLGFLQRPQRWLEAIDKYRATISGGPNFAFDLCARRALSGTATLDLRSWEVAFCAAEPIRAATVARFCAAAQPHGFDPAAFHPCYGLAEATAFVTGVRRGVGVVLAKPAAAAGPLVSCGQAAAGETVLIVDPDTREPAPHATTGEIWISGPNVAAGYWNDPDNTATTFGIPLADGTGAFMRTGDLGFVEDGNLYVCGRIKSLIIHRGNKFFAEDVEASIATCDASLGERGAAFPVEVAGEEQAVAVFEVARAAVSQLDFRAIIDQAVTAVANAHGLRLYDLVLVRPASLPRTTSGKVQRIRTRDLYLAGGLRPLEYDPVHPLLSRYGPQA